jgi:hypothetical protein
MSKNDMNLMAVPCGTHEDQGQSFGPTNPEVWTRLGRSSFDEIPLVHSGNPMTERQQLIRTEAEMRAIEWRRCELREEIAELEEVIDLHDPVWLAAHQAERDARATHP